MGTLHGASLGSNSACESSSANAHRLDTCPAGIVRRMIQGGQGLLQVFTGQDAQSAETMRAWKAVAEQAWVTAGHPGWNVVQERMVGRAGTCSMLHDGTYSKLLFF